MALVAIPLSISLALAGGATPTMGIITAVWAGLLAALLGGSNFNVVGPTGALSGILAAFALTHGAQALPYLAVLSGLLIAVVFALRLERFIILIPASVVHGFTLGVALTIGLNQFNFALGLAPHVQHDTLVANLLESLRHLGEINLAAAGLFVAGLALLLVLSARAPKVPWIILVALGGMGLGALSRLHVVPLMLPTLLSKFGQIPGQIAAPVLPSLHGLNAGLIAPVFTITLVAVLETLISAKIADGMTRTKANQRREMLGLAIANIGSGLMGGIPATAALARTSLNVKTGARHRTSAGLAALTVALISAVLLPFFSYLPLAIVASILVFVALRMVKAEHFAQLYRYDRASFYLSLAVAAITFGIDPMIGIGVGVGAALLMFVYRLSAANAEVNLNDEAHNIIQRVPATSLAAAEHQGDTVVYRFTGELIYLNAQAHLKAVERINGDTSAVILSLRRLYYLDTDGIEALAEMVESLERRDMVVMVAGANQLIAPLLQRAVWYQQLKRDGRIAETTDQALTSLRRRRSRTGTYVAPSLAA